MLLGNRFSPDNPPAHPPLPGPDVGFLVKLQIPPFKLFVFPFGLDIERRPFFISFTENKKPPTE